MKPGTYAVYVSLKYRINKLIKVCAVLFPVKNLQEQRPT